MTPKPNDKRVGEVNEWETEFNELWGKLFQCVINASQGLKGAPAPVVNYGPIVKEFIQKAIDCAVTKEREISKDD